MCKAILRLYCHMKAGLYLYIHSKFRFEYAQCSILTGQLQSSGKVAGFLHRLSFMYDASHLLPFGDDFQVHRAVPRGRAVIVDKGLLGDLVNSMCNMKRFRVKIAFY